MSVSGCSSRSGEATRLLELAFGFGIDMVIIVESNFWNGIRRFQNWNWLLDLGLTWVIVMGLGGFRIGIGRGRG